MKRNKGFSLIELIIAIAILVILTGLLAPQFMRYMEKAREAKDLQTLDTLYQTVKVTLADEEVYKEIQLAVKGGGTPADRDKVAVLTAMLTTSANGALTGKGLTLKAILENAAGEGTFGGYPTKFCKEVAAVLGGASRENLWVSKAVAEAAKKQLGDTEANATVYVLLDPATFQFQVWIGTEVVNVVNDSIIVGPEDDSYVKSSGTRFYISD